MFQHAMKSQSLCRSARSRYVPRSISVIATMGLMVMPSAAAQNRQPPLFSGPFSTRVEVVVTSDTRKAEITSFLTRELRQLEGVTIVDDDPEWRVTVVALEVKNINSNAMGYAVSVLITNPWQKEAIRFYRDAITDPAAKTTFDYIAPDAEEVMDLWLRTAPLEGLRSLCESIIADFDGQHLEKSRQTHSKLQNMMRDQRNKKPPLHNYH